MDINWIASVCTITVVSTKSPTWNFKSLTACMFHQVSSFPVQLQVSAACVNLYLNQSLRHATWKYQAALRKLSSGDLGYNSSESPGRSIKGVTTKSLK